MNFLPNTTIQRMASMAHRHKHLAQYAFGGLLIVMLAPAAIFVNRPPQSNVYQPTAIATSTKSEPSNKGAASTEVPINSTEHLATGDTTNKASATGAQPPMDSATRSSTKNTTFYQPTPLKQIQPPTDTSATKVSAVALIGAEVRCDAGLQSAIISNLAVYASGVPSSGFTISWKIESTLSFDASLTSSKVIVPGPVVPYSLYGTGDPYYLYRITPFDSGTYGGPIPAHQVRVHITAPNDIYSSWFNVPVMDATARICPA